jgi:hypothetical protein
MIFVPLPRFAFPTLRPLFCGGESGVDKCFAEIDCASCTKFARKVSRDPRHHAGANPLLKTPMAGLERGVSVGKVRPWCASSQYPQDAVQDGSAGFSKVQLWRPDTDSQAPDAWNSAIVRGGSPSTTELHVVPLADHFAFLPPCSDALKKVASSICTDAPDFDRAALIRNSIRKSLHSSLGHFADDCTI